MTRHRSWVIVRNNPPDGWTQRLEALGYVYLVGQMERGESGTLHLQAYVSLTNAISMTSLKVMLPGAKLIVASGSAAQNKIYCTKLESRVTGDLAYSVEKGVMPEQGSHKKKYSEMMADMLVLEEVEMYEKYEVQYAQWGRGLRRYRELKFMGTAHPWKTVVTVYWGATGTGKTYRAYQESGATRYLVCVPSDQSKQLWLDRYTGQENACIDEFDGQIAYRSFLRLLDSYTLTLQAKGGMVTWRPKHIWITSNVTPSAWYPGEVYSPLKRRLTTGGSSITELTEFYVEPDLTETELRDLLN